MKSMLRSVAVSNMYLLNMIRSLYYLNTNRIACFLQNNASKMDIFSSDEIRENNKHIYKISNNKEVTFVKTYAESLRYGHVQSVLEYAGLDLKDAFYFPAIEHGAYLDPSVLITRGIVASMGQYRIDCIHHLYPNIPVFLLGPYIHYAKHYYDESKLIKLKKQLGKTLLIFPAHSIESASAKYDIQNFVKTIISEQASNYDTLLACIYWKDFDTVVYDILKANGFLIASAGYRWDYNFIRRLKTIISLSDTVVSNSTGTHVGYSVYMDKPVKIIGRVAYLDSTNKLLDYDESAESYLYTLFSKEIDFRTQKDACEPYWGLSKVKTPDEIKEILYLSKKIIKGSLGIYSRYPEVVQKLLHSDLTDMQRKLLTDAVN